MGQITGQRRATRC